MRSKGSASAWEALWRQAVARVLKGQTQAAVAEGLGVHTVTVAKWMARYRAAGEAGLAAKPTPGRPCFLSSHQEGQVKTWLSQKPTEHGFPTDLWSARRIVELVRRKFGVAFHPASIRRWLTARGYSPQRLAADSKKASETSAHIVLIDESGLFLNPLVRRTWAPKGQTPVLEADGGHRKKVSVIGGISV